MDQNHINALISYFFLGPLFLLAKKGTPLADPYVQRHARSSSKIIGLTFVAILIYFMLRGYIGISFFGIDIRTIVIASIMTVSIIFLMRGAYRAYHGDVIDSFTSLSGTTMLDGMNNMDIVRIEREEDSIRILASLIPYVGIFVSSRHDSPLITRARIIGSTFMMLYIVASFFGHGDESFVSFIILAVGIIALVVEGVSLLLMGRWVVPQILSHLPNAAEVEAHIIASMQSIGLFLRVIVGGEKTMTYTEYYTRALEQVAPGSGEIAPYFMPVGLIGLPIWNLFTLPSLFISRYRPYRGLIIEGALITLIFILGWILTPGYMDTILLVLLFPIVDIMSSGMRNVEHGTPILRLISGIFIHVHTLQSDMRATTTQTERYTYDAAPENPNPPSASDVISRI